MAQALAASVADAARQYGRRQDRTEHPAGGFDKKLRWYPSDEEARPCCNAIRNPSAAFPYSLNRHCRSAAHVAALRGVDATELRRAIRAGGN